MNIGINPTPENTNPPPFFINQPSPNDEKYPNGGYRNNKFCPDLVNTKSDIPIYYEWAELKSSILVNELYKDLRIHQQLVLFATNIVTIIVERANVEFDQFVDSYSINPLPPYYPVGQNKSFQSQPGEIKKNFYI
jgi:hypothetical protein